MTGIVWSAILATAGLLVLALFQNPHIVLTERYLGFLKQDISEFNCYCNCPTNSGKPAKSQFQL